ncbi:E3 ubiquitin-protein ligase RNF31 isoform X2 [Cololabis saira]|uniref:E3 ubiquitin-protein ligase RNF31 isoform X2 n=1 Tax=Cololabis saira TaxID=129043 RepID=UPI002AD354F1|nr:E3 ubiquitin-protein ligase RNF31 isoform X2 [Cololabis saira]
MPRVGAEAELQTLTECHYKNPAETLQDLQAVRSLFPDLRLYLDFYCFPNKDKKKLVFLAGTLPVHYEGSQYNIPVCIWLHETHPMSRPRCYVVPSATMVINPSCPCVDVSGNIVLTELRNWTHGMSNLSLLVSEMRQAFQKETPLFARYPIQVLPTTAMQMSTGGVPSAGSIRTPMIGSLSSRSHHLSSTASQLSGQKANLWETRVRTSYTEELLGIDFSAPPPSSNNPFLNSSSSSGEPPSKMMGALTIDGDQEGDSPMQRVRSEATTDGHGSVSSESQQNFCPQSGPASGPDLSKVVSCLPPDQAALFLSLMMMQGQSFNHADVMEAVQLNRDLTSALRFLTHRCPICHDQVSFSRIVPMTHCSCFLCQSCFTSFFSVAIKERSVDQLVCPQCGQPDIHGLGGLGDAMDYFNLLDTQIRHFLPPQIHELFQRKLRDRALLEMPNFCWCAHCSFGMLHEADTLRMDCPSCKKSTCSQCRLPWSSQHQGLSCDQFRVWQEQNQPDHHKATLLYNSIECPSCQFIYNLSRGGCLHFTCSHCGHQFCGGCKQRFALGSSCNFSGDCGSKGLHAHHPRDCLYHLRDWSVSRLHLLLQYYRVSPSLVKPPSSSPPDISQTACSVMELRDDGGMWDEPCGQPTHPEYRGYCQMHYKEHLVELINRCRGDPAVLYTQAEMAAELQRWHVDVPSRKTDEPEPLYVHRLCLTLTSSIPLRRQRHSPIKLTDGR